MTDIYECHGAVYILENPKAQRIKVGTTINDVAQRLRSINGMWLEIVTTCQICGRRRQRTDKGTVPRHFVSGRECPGSGEMPLEKDVSLAEVHLANMKADHANAAGAEKGSMTNMIKNFEKRIEQLRNHQSPVGMWHIHTVFYTRRAYLVEKSVHQQLDNCLDQTAPFGEVFTCSVAEATAAIEMVLARMGLLDSVRKDVQTYEVSAEFGECPICRGPVTASGACPNCMERFRN